MAENALEILKLSRHCEHLIFWNGYVPKENQRYGQIKVAQKWGSSSPQEVTSLKVWKPISSLLLRPRKNEDTLWPVMLPARGKTRQHCCAGHKKCFWRFSEAFYVSRTQNLCRTQMLRAWQKESTFGKHDHVSNVAATMCPRFAGALLLMDELGELSTAHWLR